MRDLTSRSRGLAKLAGLFLERQAIAPAVTQAAQLNARGLSLIMNELKQPWNQDSEAL